MHEKLIEHWLTNVNELGYQIPLCEALLADGYTILHVSRHGRGEHGKDIVARDPTGRLITFQLKGGDINLAKWHEIRGEVEELVQLPVMLPGIRPDEEHQPILVTNGELRGDATPSTREFSQTWQRKGFGLLDVWQKRALQQRFLSAHGSYLPASELRDFKSLLELFVADFADGLPRAKFAEFIVSLYPSGTTDTQRRRALTSAALIGSYVVSQYEAAQNYVAAMEGWTVIAALIMYAAERDNLLPKSYADLLTLVEDAFDRNADAFTSEVIALPDLVSSDSCSRRTRNCVARGHCECLAGSPPCRCAHDIVPPGTRLTSHKSERLWAGNSATQGSPRKRSGLCSIDRTVR